MSQILSDDFSDPALDDAWDLEGPAGTVGLASDGSDDYLEIVVPEGNHDAWNSNLTTRLMQDAADEDFTVEAKFLSTPTQGYQMQGILVEQDANTWIRFDVYHDGSKLHVFGATTTNGWSAPRFNLTVAAASAQYLRVSREGDVWTFQYSADGQSWTTAGTYTYAMTVTSVGLFAGATNIAGGGPGYTAQVDYFNNTAAPIVDEDAGNAAPAAADDTVSTTVDTALVLTVADLLANDGDADGDALTLAGVGQPAHGTLVDNGDGTLTYTPAAGYAGGDAFTYTVSDGTSTDTAVVSITVAEPAPAPPDNTAPVAGDDAETTAEDAARIIALADLLANDSDADGDALYLAGFTQPAHGSLVDNGDGTLTYTPDADYSGPDSFTYTVSDGTDTDTATVDIAVTAVNDAPVAGADAATTTADTPLVLSIAGLLGNDDDADGDALSLAGFTQPAHGSLVDNGDGTLTYTPDAGYAGVDGFAYTIDDGAATSTGSVALTVDAPAPQGIRSDDFSGSALDAMWTLEGPAGTATVGVSGDEAYLQIAVPEGIYDAWNTNTTARLLQDAVDDDFQVQARFLTTPTQRFQMQGILIEQDAGTWIRFDVYHNGSKLYIFGATTTNGWSAVKFNTAITAGSAAQMQVTREGDVWSFRYSADGQTWTTAGSFTYAMTVTAVGPFAGATGTSGAGPGYTAQIDYFFNTAAPIVPEDDLTPDTGNTLPVAGADTVATPEDTAVVIAVADLLANDDDADGDPLSVAGFAQPTHGTLTDNGDGTLTYTPDADYAGADSFTYTVSDGSGTATGTVDVAVAAVNDAPVAADDTASTTAGTPLLISVAALLANDADADGDVLGLAGFTQPAHGTLVDNGDGTLTYTPDAGYTGADGFSYTVGDGAATSTADVALTVTAEPGIRSDDFDGAVLDAMWSLQGPAGSAGLGASGAEAYLQIVVPEGKYDAWNTNTTTRLLQDAVDEDFEIQAKFLSTPSQRYQMQGILIEQDAGTWIRFDVYHDGAKLYIFGATTTNGWSAARFNKAIAPDSATHMQVTRDGDVWTFRYSADGETWSTAGSFTYAMTVTGVGPFAGATASSGSGPGYTAQVDYFFNTAAPIDPEDPPVSGNYPPVAVDDAVTTAPDTAVVISVAALMANDGDANGDGLSFAGFTQPTHGTLADNGDGTLTYTPDTGYSGADAFTYTISDGTADATATVDVSVTSIIDVWYGSHQEFGHLGEAQRWVNILGTVDVSQVTGLTYSLNGGPEQTLSIGPDTRRLEDPGDFNVDLDYAQLDGSAADDVVTLTATLSDGSTVTRDVVIAYEDGVDWAKTYSIDWSTVTNIQDVVQVVDGRWVLTGDGVRTAAPGYDRVLALGDAGWDNYEARLSITIHDINEGTPRDGAGFGVGMLWNGHTNAPISGWQPFSGWDPIVSPFYDIYNDAFVLHDYPYWGPPDLDLAPYTFEEGKSYDIVVRIEQTDVFDRIYSFKIWETGTAEPADWLIYGVDEMTGPTTGAFVFIAHHWDITVGDIAVTEITGSDIIAGKDSDDLVVAVDTAQANPGLGEIDVLIGGDGADVFVFGNAGGDFYDDGNAATAGTDDYALIWDFESGVDKIQLADSLDAYLIADTGAGLPDGAGIYHINDSGPHELIGIVAGVEASALQADDFVDIWVA